MSVETFRRRRTSHLVVPSWSPDFSCSRNSAPASASPAAVATPVVLAGILDDLTCYQRTPCGLAQAALTGIEIGLMRHDWPVTALMLPFLGLHLCMVIYYLAGAQTP